MELFASIYFTTYVLDVCVQFLLTSAPRLFLDTFQITNTKVFDRMSECDLPFLGRMLELVMISYTVDLYPSSNTCQHVIYQCIPKGHRASDARVFSSPTLLSYHIFLQKKGSKKEQKPS